jgi:ADP-ribosylglycohydrolase
MRVSPVGFTFNTVDEVLAEAEKSAAVTHNHPEGIKGAKSVALAVYLARTGPSKEVIKQEIGSRFSYNLNRTLAEIRPKYKFDVSCQGSVPEAIIAFLVSDDFEDAVRKAVSVGGDSNTIACISRFL